MLKGVPEVQHFEDDLQSDVPIVGETTIGPHRIEWVLRHRDDGQVASTLHLRTGLHTSLAREIVVDGELAPTDTSAYHGGSIADEIAALLSLELGVRVRNSGTRTVSLLHDPGETPRLLRMHVSTLVRPGTPGREVLPAVTRRPANVSSVALLPSFPSLSAKIQTALVRAARQYSAAVWWANEDPNQAWIQLVSAVEVAAKGQQSYKAEPEELIQEIDPQLWDLLKDLPSERRIALAKKLAPPLRATWTFCKFIEEFAPAPPTPRPEFGGLDWDRLADHAKVIYKHRSLALHAATPFPAPMLEDRIDVSEDGALQEVPFGLNSGAYGAIWNMDEYPMLLSTFEHIVRGCLLNWWSALT